MKEKTLVLFKSNNIYYFGNLNIPNVDICSVFEDDMGTKHFLCRVARRLNLSFTKLYYSDWYKNLRQYGKIIVMDVMFTYDHKLLENIAKKAPHAQRYLYSWNIVKDENAYKEMRQAADEAGFKIYCYDCGNCAKYGMKFNTIMYDSKICLTETKPVYDALFLGYLKDRKEPMELLHASLKKAGLCPRFMVIEEQCEEDSVFEYKKEYVDYYLYLNMVNESRAIIDIAQEGQDGFSMRVMESIFLNKKLITTNQALKKAKFYDSNNILVITLDETSTETILDFYKKEFHPYTNDVRDYYSFENWIERFT